MQNRYKLVAIGAALAGLWCTTPMAADIGGTVSGVGNRLSAIGGGSNPPNQGASAQGMSGSQVTPRTTGGSAAPYQSAPAPRFLSRRSTTTETTVSSAPAPSSDTTLSAAPSSDSTTMSSSTYSPSPAVADSATRRPMRRDRN